MRADSGSGAQRGALRIAAEATISNGVPGTVFWDLVWRDVLQDVIDMR
jgi:hypothetical protein